MENRVIALKNALRHATGRLLILGHDNPDMDSLLSCVLMQRLTVHFGLNAKIVLPTPADGQCMRLMPRLRFDPEAWRGETQEGDTLILVDHHAPQHAGHVAAVIDHHPTDFPPDAPFVWIAQSGACAAMVYRLMRAAGMAVTEEDEKLAVTALYLDTLALRSTKILPEEIAWAKARAHALQMDEGWLVREGLCLQDASWPAKRLAMTGKKRFEYGGKVVFSTYVQLDGMPERLKNELLTVLKEELKSCGADMWVFLFHDPVAGNSVEYDLLPDGTVETIDHGHLVSRGKDVMPRIEKRMRENNGCKA